MEIRNINKKYAAIVVISLGIFFTVNASQSQASGNTSLTNFYDSLYATDSLYVFDSLYIINEIRVGSGLRILNDRLFNNGAKLLIQSEPGSSFPTIINGSNAANVGIGTLNPSARLDVAGRVRMTGFHLASNPEAGHVLVSDAMGVGSWADLSTLSSWANTGNSIAYTEGNVGIGTDNPEEKLDVCGIMRAKEVVVEALWCDYVFEDSYELRSLEEVERYIDSYKHLPDIPSAQAIESDGLKLSEISSKFMLKIEELTLYLIEQDKKIDELAKENAEMHTEIRLLKETK